MRPRYFYLFLWIALLALLLPSVPLWAAFGEDIEKPKPEFSQEGGDWIARLVPRGKSTSVQIRFHLEGGDITQAAAIEFAPAEQPKVDSKNFRSDFFKVEANLPPGSEAVLAASSDYFTSATELWGAQPGAVSVWGTLGATNVGLADRVNRLTVAVKDGGPLDADGQADGRLMVIFGPRDSFWGYALGTLFIRFFGIFLVLSILMLGMNLSGQVFQRMDRRKEQRSTMVAAALEQVIPQAPEELPAELAAAAAVALHLHLAAGRAQTPAGAATQGFSAWSQNGRAKLMTDRMPVFNRIQRK
jgi:Na+-transporting methylmalonyl-CoA/oxaloacetate decarboxylase gamma subunit